MPYWPTGEQEAIIAHDAYQHARILAGPGTGKSATMVALVDHLLAGNPASRLKLLTFTRAASKVARRSPFLKDSPKQAPSRLPIPMKMEREQQIVVAG